MRVHAILEGDPRAIAAGAKVAEVAGFDGISTTETIHDPFISLALVATSTARIELGTAIAVAFPRSPWNLAQMANDLQLVSRGRFVLGLGSQVRAHIERRFNASFDHPAARMRELVLAVRAIWAAWEDDTALRFEGDFYRHTLLGSMFNPGPNEFGNPNVLTAAVGPQMTRVAGEVADGILVHGFSTPRYLQEATMPALAEGLRLSGRSRADIQVCRPVFLVTGVDEQEVATAGARARSRLAFYGATPAYQPVLDRHGWGDLHPELLRLSKEGRSAEMAGLIDDEILDAFALVAPLDRIPALVAERYGGVVDRISFNADIQRNVDCWGAVIEQLRAIPAGQTTQG